MRMLTSYLRLDCGACRKIIWYRGNFARSTGKFSNGFYQFSWTSPFSRYKNLIHRRGTINLKGRKLQVTSFERPPFCYMKTTKNVTIDGEELQIYTADKGILKWIIKKSYSHWSVIHSWRIGWSRDEIVTNHGGKVEFHVDHERYSEKR